MQGSEAMELGRRQPVPPGQLAFAFIMNELGAGGGHVLPPPPSLKLQCLKRIGLNQVRAPPASACGVS